jgi:Ca-activated chloride channel family protein
MTAVTRLILIGAVTATIWAAPLASVAQSGKSVPPPPIATFKSSIDLVRVSAVVRDRKGRFVPNLTARDFEVFDGGITRRIADFRRDDAGASVALLFDVSGSMEARLGQAREAATHLLSWLDADDDEVAVYTFDTRLDEVRGFTPRMQKLPEQLNSVKPFGATSLYDAIARTAEKVGARDAMRRAVVVFTDGLDTSSRLTASEVSGIASSIDVPVYIVGVVPSIDNPSASTTLTTVERSVLTGALSNLANWTGGEIFIVSTPVDRSKMARRIVDELRHLYLIAFESGSAPGWHPLIVQMRDKDLTVRARSGYIAGQSRPIS